MKSIRRHLELRRARLAGASLLLSVVSVVSLACAPAEPERVDVATSRDGDVEGARSFVDDDDPAPIAEPDGELCAVQRLPLREVQRPIDIVLILDNSVSMSRELDAIERSTIAAQLRLNYAFTPDLTLEGYAEPFAASGRYYDFGELSAPRSRVLLFYGPSSSSKDPSAPGTTTVTRNTSGGYVATTGGGAPFTVVANNPDFNRLSLRSNLVLRWEWARGSTFFLIWQQNRQSMVAVGDLVRPGSLWDATTARGENFLAVKVSYWLSVR